jgi:hypothetical protein
MALEYIACIFQRFSKRQHAIEYKKKKQKQKVEGIYSLKEGSNDTFGHKHLLPSCVCTEV